MKEPTNPNPTTGNIGCTENSLAFWGKKKQFRVFLRFLNNIFYLPDNAEITGLISKAIWLSSIKDDKDPSK